MSSFRAPNKATNLCGHSQTCGERSTHVRCDRVSFWYCCCRCLLRIILQIFPSFNVRSHLVAFRRFFTSRFRLLCRMYTKKPQNLRFTRMLRTVFLFQSVVVTGNARIRLAFSTEFQIHIIITLHTLNEVDVDTGPTRWIQAPKSIFVVRIERVCRALLSHRGRSSPRSRVAQHIRVFACERVSPFRPHNSTIVKMTPMLSSTIFDFRMQLASIFIRRVVHERRTHSPNGRYTREPSARPAVESVCIDHDFMTTQMLFDSDISKIWLFNTSPSSAHWQYFDFYVHFIRRISSFTAKTHRKTGSFVGLGFDRSRMQQVFDESRSLGIADRSRWIFYDFYAI